MAGKVHHWKHGWIPLDATARAEKGAPTLGLTNAAKIKNAETMFGTGSAQHKAAIKRFSAPVADKPTTSGIKDLVNEKATGSHYQQVDGAPNVVIDASSSNAMRQRVDTDGFAYSDPSRWTHKDDKVTIAKAAQEVYDRFPGLAKRQSTITFSPVNSHEEFFAATPSSDPYMIAVDHTLFNKAHTASVMHDQAENRMGIAAYAPTVEDYQRRVIIHEMGHVLHVLDEDDHGQSSEIAQFTSAPMTPRQAGFKEASVPAFLDEKVPRWAVDALRDKNGLPESTYATGNKYEWFAEAFADGFINGNKATPAGKRAMEIATKLYGVNGTNAENPLNRFSRENGWDQ